MLVDCGEATQMQLIRYGLKASKIDYIFISHLHGDHYFGVFGLISSMNLNGRKSDLYIFAPEGLDRLFNLHFSLSKTELQFDLRFFTLQALPGIILEHKNFIVESFELYHSIACNGFKFTERQKKRRLNKEKANFYQIPESDLEAICLGADFLSSNGHRIPNAELTYEPLPLKSYVFCSDTRYEPGLRDVCENATLMYHEATFLYELKKRAEITFHSTAREAALLARDSRVERLLLGHFSARYKDLSPLLAEAQAVFHSSFLATEGFCFSV